MMRVEAYGHPPRPSACEAIAVGGRSGVRGENALESALARPRQRWHHEKESQLVEWLRPLLTCLTLQLTVSPHGA